MAAYFGGGKPRYQASSTVSTSSYSSDPRLRQKPAPATHHTTSDAEKSSTSPWVESYSTTTTARAATYTVASNQRGSKSSTAGSKLPPRLLKSLEDLIESEPFEPEGVASGEQKPKIVSSTHRCGACDKAFRTREMYEQHIMGKDHIAKIKEQREREKTGEGNKPNSHVSGAHGDIYSFCQVCKLSCYDEQAWTIHVSSEDHIIKLKSYEKTIMGLLQQSKSGQISLPFLGAGGESSDQPHEPSGGTPGSYYQEQEASHSYVTPSQQGTYYDQAGSGHPHYVGSFSKQEKQQYGGEKAGHTRETAYQLQHGVPASSSSGYSAGQTQYAEQELHYVDQDHEDYTEYDYSETARDASYGRGQRGRGSGSFGGRAGPGHAGHEVSAGHHRAGYDGTVAGRGSRAYEGAPAVRGRGGYEVLPGGRGSHHRRFEHTSAEGSGDGYEVSPAGRGRGHELLPGGRGRGHESSLGGRGRGHESSPGGRGRGGYELSSGGRGRGHESSPGGRGRGGYELSSGGRGRGHESSPVGRGRGHELSPVGRGRGGYELSSGGRGRGHESSPGGRGRGGYELSSGGRGRGGYELPAAGRERGSYDSTRGRGFDSMHESSQGGRGRGHIEYEGTPGQRGRGDHLGTSQRGRGRSYHESIGKHGDRPASGQPPGESYEDQYHETYEETEAGGYEKPARGSFSSRRARGAPSSRGTDRRTPILHKTPYESEYQEAGHYEDTEGYGEDYYGDEYYAYEHGTEEYDYTGYVGEEEYDESAYYEDTEQSVHYSGPVRGGGIRPSRPDSGEQHPEGRVSRFSAHGADFSGRPDEHERFHRPQEGTTTRLSAPHKTEEPRFAAGQRSEAHRFGGAAGRGRDPNAAPGEPRFRPSIPDQEFRRPRNPDGYGEEHQPPDNSSYAADRYCPLCEMQLVNASEWHKHVYGPKHARHVRATLEDVGMDGFVKQYGDLPIFTGRPRVRTEHSQGRELGSGWVSTEHDGRGARPYESRAGLPARGRGYNEQSYSGPPAGRAEEEWHEEAGWPEHRGAAGRGAVPYDRATREHHEVGRTKAEGRHIRDQNAVRDISSLIDHLDLSHSRKEEIRSILMKHIKETPDMNMETLKSLVKTFMSLHSDKSPKPQPYERAEKVGFAPLSGAVPPGPGSRMVRPGLNKPLLPSPHGGPPKQGPRNAEPDVQPLMDFRGMKPPDVEKEFKESYPPRRDTHNREDPYSNRNRVDRDRPRESDRGRERERDSWREREHDRSRSRDTRDEKDRSRDRDRAGRSSLDRDKEYRSRLDRDRDSSKWSRSERSSSQDQRRERDSRRDRNRDEKSSTSQPSNKKEGVQPETKLPEKTNNDKENNNKDESGTTQSEGRVTRSMTKSKEEATEPVGKEAAAKDAKIEDKNNKSQPTAKSSGTINEGDNKTKPTDEKEKTVLKQDDEKSKEQKPKDTSLEKSKTEPPANGNKNDKLPSAAQTNTDSKAGDKVPAEKKPELGKSLAVPNHFSMQPGRGALRGSDRGRGRPPFRGHFSHQSRPSPQPEAAGTAKPSHSFEELETTHSPHQDVGQPPRGRGLLSNRGRVLLTRGEPRGSFRGVPIGRGRGSYVTSQEEHEFAADESPRYEAPVRGRGLFRGRGEIRGMGSEMRGRGEIRGIGGIRGRGELRGRGEFVRGRGEMRGRGEYRGRGEFRGRGGAPPPTRPMPPEDYYDEQEVKRPRMY